MLRNIMAELDEMLTMEEVLAQIDELQEYDLLADLRRYNMQITEYRGVEGLVYAEVTQDDSGNYVTGTVKELAGVAEISRSTNSSSEAHYYDNLAAVVVESTGADTVTINTSAIPMDVYADITGQYYDENTGMLVEQERAKKYFAIGYQTKKTNGDVMFVWRLKGTFNVPDETNVTENDGTDANGQELTYTGISTTHRFEKTGKRAKANIVDTSVNPIDEGTFFGTVQTPDTIAEPIVAPSVSVVPSRASVKVGGKIKIGAETVPAGQSVTWTTSDNTKATVSSNGTVTGVAAGSATITATITYDGSSYTDTCAVTVVAN